MKSVSDSTNFRNFVLDAYSEIDELFHIYRIPPKGNKCNWCIMCKKLQDIFTSTQYKLKCMKAFGVNNLLPMQNPICTKVYFSLLQEIVSMERNKMQEEIRVADVSDVIKNLTNTDRMVLHYVAGATIHNDASKPKEGVKLNMINHIHKAKIEFKCTQLLQSLRIPVGHAVASTSDPDSLLEIFWRHHLNQGLTVVSDDTFDFFKVFYCKVNSVLTVKNLKCHKIDILKVCECNLKQDETLLEMWCNLFVSKSDSCKCSQDIEDESFAEQSEHDVIDYELEECLVLDLFDRVLHYFASVQLSDRLDNHKDTVVHKEKEVSLTHNLLSGMKKEAMKKIIQFPCGHCGKESVDVESLQDAQFEDFSVGCDKCQQWFHYMCMGLKGNEPELSEGSNLEYFCSKFKKTTKKSSNAACQLNKSDTHSVAKSKNLKGEEVQQSNSDNLNTSAVRHSTRVRKPVHRMDY